MSIEVHVSTTRDTFGNYGYLTKNYLKLAKNKNDLIFYAHVIDHGTPAEDGHIVHYNYENFHKGLLGSDAHAVSLISAFKCNESNPNNIKLYVDSDTVMLYNNWDVYLTELFKKIDIIGSSFEDIGGPSVGSGNVQLYKRFPTFTWLACSSKVSLKDFNPSPVLQKHLLIQNEEMSKTYNLPVGYYLLRDSGWQFPEYVIKNNYKADYLRHLKPTSGAKAILTGNDYNEEFQLPNGVPFVGHQRGSRKHRFKKCELSNKFYDSVDNYVSKISLIMNIFYLYKDAQADYVCSANSAKMIETFNSFGCITLSESKFISSNFLPSKDDIIIISVSLKEQISKDKLATFNCKKILHSIDESKSDQILFRTQLEFCDQQKINTIINTYPSVRNINFLKERNISTITLPICGTPRKIDYSKKDIDIIVSGQLDKTYYPVRTKIFESLKNSNIKFVYLPHSGLEQSTARHQYHGEKFLDLLDRCWTGVTCRAGSFRDRMVAKYIEFGYSKVLPIGDCPTYMHENMSSSMIKIDENTEPDEIVSTIKESISNKEKLIERIEKYSCHVQQHYDMKKNVERTIKMIFNNQNDSLHNMVIL